MDITRQRKYYPTNTHGYYPTNMDGYYPTNNILRNKYVQILPGKNIAQQIRTGYYPKKKKLHDKYNKYYRKYCPINMHGYYLTKKILPDK